MSKPDFTAKKAILPASVISKPKGLKTKKFQMAPPDEKQSGMYNIKLRQDEEVVESLLDIDNRQ